MQLQVKRTSAKTQETQNGWMDGWMGFTVSFRGAEQPLVMLDVTRGSAAPYTWYRLDARPKRSKVNSSSEEGGDCLFAFST